MIEAPSVIAEKILLIDDNPAHLFTLAEIFQDEGMRPVRCTTGKEALERLRKEEFSVAILDLKLPDMSGLALLKSLQAINPTLKVIIHTAHATLDAAVSAVNEMAYAFVQKSDKVEELVEHVRRAFIDHLKQYNQRLEKEVAKRTAELKESEDRYRILYDDNPMMYFTVALDGTTLLVNKFGAAQLGYTVDELVGRQVWEIFFEEDREKVKETVGELILHPENTTGTWEFRKVCKNGAVIWVRESAKVTQNSDGTDVLLIVCADITAEKRAQAEVIKLSQALEQSPVSAIITDPSGKIEYVNDAYLALSERDPNEAKGRMPNVLRSEFYDDKTYVELWETITGGKFWEAPFKNKKKDGTSFWEEVRINSIKNSDGVICNYIILKVDISVRRKLEGQLRQAQKMETIGTLAGGIAHDFNNILTPIVGYSDMLLTKMSPDNTSFDDIEAIFKAANRGKDIVKQILTFSRRMEKKDPSNIFLQPVISEVVNLLQPLLPSTIKIEQDLCDECGLINADISQIHQVIMNLGTNAFHAMEKDGGILTFKLRQVKVDELVLQECPRLDQEQEYILLTVSDSGNGMSRKVANRIFEPFYTTKPVGKGTGLGLSVVHGIIRELEGDIRVMSHPDSGTTFEVYFPIVKIAKPVSPSLTRSYIHGNERLLIIDDDRSIVAMLKQMLTQVGYRVTGYHNSDHAMQYFCKNQNDFDLVVTNLTMPSKTGLNVFDEIKALKPDLPVIMLTGNVEILTSIRRNYEFQKIISKPIVVNEIAQAIRTTLDN